MRVESRRYPRRPVRLRVKFLRAKTFVEEYATNLSAGGLYVRDVHLDVHEEVEVELDLPGLGAFAMVAEVAHVTPPGAARPGAGLALRTTPPGFRAALEAYLLRLGRRAARTVLVSAEPWRGAVADAGYDVAPLPHAQALVSVLAMTETRVAGIVVPAAIADLYRSAVAFVGDVVRVIAVEPEGDPGRVLATLDEALG